MRPGRGNLGALGWVVLLVLLVLGFVTKSRLVWFAIIPLILFLPWPASWRRMGNRSPQGAGPSPGARGSGEWAASDGVARGAGAGSGAAPAGGQTPPHQGRQAEAQPARRRSPHEVLGVKPGSAPEAVRAAYVELVRQYHPDRVAHLAPEFRQIAEQRMREINAAYEALGGR